MFPCLPDEKIIISARRIQQFICDRRKKVHSKCQHIGFYIPIMLLLKTIPKRLFCQGMMDPG